MRPKVEDKLVVALDNLLEVVDELLGTDGEDGPHLSFYVTTGRLPHEGREARIRFRNELAEAEKRLQEGGEDARTVREILSPASTLIDDEQFWNHQERGLAVLVTPARTRILVSGAPLPDKWVYSSSFHLKPLLAAAAHANAYWLLQLSQHAVKLYRGSELGFREADCEGLPASFEEALRRRGFVEDSAAMAATQSQTKADKHRLRQFFEVVEEAVTRRLGRSSLPLLVAGVDYYEPIYREVNRYPGLSEAYLSGSGERLSHTELREEAVKLLRSDFQASEERELERFHAARGTGVSLDRLDLVLGASAQGQVEVLFVPCDVDLWGSYDPDDGSMILAAEPGPAATDLFELAARQTLDTGGEVFFLPGGRFPADRNCLALLRWVGDSVTPPRAFP